MTQECMICFDLVKKNNPVWNCSKCYKMLHLKCIKTWAEKSGDIWRCPNCQNENVSVPKDYFCFCGKTIDPKGAAPHSCGQTCSKINDCVHPCSLKCHQGPCPKCKLFAPAFSCFCGKKRLVVQCSKLSKAERSCKKPCGKPLCSFHNCSRVCHDGSCGECNFTVEKSCICGKTSIETDCSSPTPKCSNECGFQFDCGTCKCTRLCHSLENHSTKCTRDPTILKKCPCGKTIYHRQNCADPIIECKEKCGKTLECGHSCPMTCHFNECPPCKAVKKVQCRCKKEQLTVACSDFSIKKCNNVCMKRKCSRHKCTQVCCDLESHYCNEMCGKILSCRIHKCSYECGHFGRCHECFEGISTQDLYCDCGKTMMRAPIPCGVSQVICKYPCVKRLECGHSNSSHECHSNSVSCPPCMKFVPKQCACGKTRVNIPCSRTEKPSCGEKCLKQRPDCLHECNRLCHSDECTSVKCLQKCNRNRVCGHVCRYNCHSTRACTEDRPCLFPLLLKCECGRISKKTPCNSLNFQITQHNSIECDSECKRLLRNQRFAEALNINTKISKSTTKIYSASLVAFASKNLKWVYDIEKSIIEFIQKSKQSNQVEITHFPVFKREFNQFLVEYLESFGLFSQIIDAGSSKPNVLVKSTNSMQLPSVFLSKVALDYDPEEHCKYESFDNLLRKIHRGSAVNCIVIKNLSTDLEENDLSVLLENLFENQYAIGIKRMESDLILVLSAPNGQPLPIEDAELVLVEKSKLLQEKFVQQNQWADSVVATWITKDGEIKPRQAVSTASSTTALVIEPEKIVLTNSFSSLNNC